MFIFFIAFLGCNNHENTSVQQNNQIKENSSKIPEFVKSLVSDYAFSNNSKLNRDTQFKIEEFDVMGLKEDYDGRIYNVKYISPILDDQFNGVVLLHINNKIVPIASNFLGNLLSATIQNGKLYFTCSYGSGVHRSKIGMLRLNQEELNVVYSESFVNTDLFVRQVGNCIQVETGFFFLFNKWSTFRQIGWVSVKEESLEIVTDSLEKITRDKKELYEGIKESIQPQNK